MILGLGLASACAWAQVASEPAKPATPAKAPVDAKVAETPKKTEPKKPAPRKTEPKKTAPKKAEPPKKAATPAPVSTDPNVKVFKAGSKDAPILRDKQGNVIPTNPDAYDVSSATKK
jgi:hypothetical protein